MLYSLTSTRLFYEVILTGFTAAIMGFVLASDPSLINNEKNKEEFKNECEIFSKAAKDIDELLKTTMEEREGWLELENEKEGLFAEY